MRSLLSEFCENAHSDTIPPPSALVASTTAPRRRNGTIANHTAQPIASASSAPRE